MSSKCNFIIQHHLNELLTRKWLTGSHAVDTICVTVEDYFNDFNKIKKPFNQVGWQQNQRWLWAWWGIFDVLSWFVQEMTSAALRRVVVEYVKAVMQKRIAFRNADERREGAERMIKEANQFKFLFRKLSAVSSHITAPKKKQLSSPSHSFICSPCDAFNCCRVCVYVRRVKTQIGCVVLLLPLLRCSSWLTPHCFS